MWVPQIYDDLKTVVNEWIAEKHQPLSCWEDNLEPSESEDIILNWLNDLLFKHQSGQLYAISVPSCSSQESLLMSTLEQPRENGFFCYQCDPPRPFKKLGYCNYHKTNEQGQYSCEKCSHIFIRKFNLLVHMQRKNPCDAISNAKPRFECDLCGLTYKCYRSLQFHKRKHL